MVFFSRFSEIFCSFAQEFLVAERKYFLRNKKIIVRVAGFSVVLYYYKKLSFRFLVVFLNFFGIFCCLSEFFFLAEHFCGKKKIIDRVAEISRILSVVF